MTERKVVAAIAVVGVAILAGVAITRALCRGVKVTFRAPPSIRVCTRFTMEGDVTKDCKGLAGKSVTIFSEVEGMSIPIATVITDSKGHYAWTDILGTEDHIPLYFETRIPFWAEVPIDGVKYRTDRVTVILYAEACTGPCLGKLRIRRG
jgi:hypothetical protein